MDFKSLAVKSLELKDATADEGRFVGLASVYNIVDRVNDVVMAGAFRTSLAEKGGRVPLCWQHDQRNPIGLGQVTDTDLGLQIEAKVLLTDPVGQRAWGLMKAGVLDSLSIGYDTVRSTMNRQGVRELHELKLWEVSLVTIPANPMTTVLGMKANRVIGAIDAVRSAEDGAVDALFDAVSEMGTTLADEKKAGRVLSARNIALVKAAAEALSALMAVADKENPEPQEGTEEQKQVEAQTAELLSLTQDIAAFAASLKRE